MALIHKAKPLSGGGKIIYLGEGRTFDISSIVGIENVGKYTANDFILSQVKIDTKAANSGNWGYAIPTSYGHVECDVSAFTKEYDNTTGILMLSGGVLRASGYARDTTNNSNKLNVSVSHEILPNVYLVDGFDNSDVAIFPSVLQLTCSNASNVGNGNASYDFDVRDFSKITLGSIKMVTGGYASSTKTLTVNLIDADTGTVIKTDSFSGTSVSREDVLTDIDISSVNNLKISLTISLAAASSTGSNGSITISKVVFS